MSKPTKERITSSTCETGCTIFHGGEIRHYKDCQFYPESLSELLESQAEMLKVARACVDWYSDGLYAGDVSETRPGEFRAGERARACLALLDEMEKITRSCNT